MSVIIRMLCGMLFCATIANAGPPNPTDSDIDNNTAGGSLTLDENIGSENTGFGASVMMDNQGDHNSGFGAGAMYDMQRGGNNTCIGMLCLSFNRDGSYNTAAGVAALYGNTFGFANTALGFNAARGTTEGKYNTALGYQALLRNRLGVNNTAVGSTAGWLLTNGSNNLYLGSPGVAAESATLRLGSIQTRAFIKGVAGVVVRGQAVCINQGGQLGTCVSEESGLVSQLIDVVAQQTARIEALSAQVRALQQ